MMTDFIVSGAALALVIGLIVGLAWFMRRFSLTPIGLPHGRKKEIKILESQMIDTRCRLILVSWRGKDYLLATSEQGVTQIDQQPAKMDPVGEGEGDE